LQLITLPAFQNSKRVSVYLSTDFEVGTLSIVKKLFEQKKEVREGEKSILGEILIRFSH
jgi:5-formyltetrahydrofolate cyclo-ligase